MYKIDIPHALNDYLKESSCNTCKIQVDITIGDKTFLGYLELME